MNRVEVCEILSQHLIDAASVDLQVFVDEDVAKPCHCDQFLRQANRQDLSCRQPLEQLLVVRR